MEHEYFIEAEFQADRSGVDDIRNILRREGLKLRYIGRIHNKQLFEFINYCDCTENWFPRLIPLSEYMTHEEYQNVTFEMINGGEITKHKMKKYNPFAKYPKTN